MSRRVSLPGADLLFRSHPEPPAEPPPGGAEGGSDVPAPPAGRESTAAPEGQATGPQPEVPDGEREATVTRTSSRPSGRPRHDEKITVYISAAELLELERARLTLRAEHGLAVDRGRVVREAVAEVLADLDAHGEASTLVRRLRTP